MLPPEKLAVITMNTTLNLILKCGNSGVRVCVLTKEIGELVKTEINLQKLQSNKNSVKEWQKKLIKEAEGNQKLAKVLSKRLLEMLNEEDWTLSMKVKVGAALLTFLKEIARTKSGSLAIEHKNVRESNSIKTTSLIYFDHKFFEELAMKDLTNLYPRFLPMVVPPNPWNNHTMTGGYLRLRAPLIKTYSVHHMDVARAAYMPKMLEGLDFLGGQAWRINSFMLHIIKEAWSRGELIGELPPIKNLPLPNIADCPLPLLPSSDATVGSNEASNISAGSPSEKYDEKFYQEMCRRVRKKNSEYHSLRADMQLKLWVAEQFQGQNIYYPHNIDFRGRAYPVPPNLSHLGSDLCRGLLLFAQGKKLGKEGLIWLKIHLANLFGHNKITHEERLNWTEAHWDRIVDSYRNPLDGQRWWTTAEEPFQALAVCKELVSAYDTGRPENYECNLPIHQDGSCNGLQHYAALGGDTAGAKAVNLSPNDRPQDVYGAVLEIVIKTLNEHCSIPPDEPTEAIRKKGEYARMLLEKVDRKVVKQTIMTSVYGVTRVGAREQVQNRLLEKFASTSPDVMTPAKEKEIYGASM